MTDEDPTIEQLIERSSLGTPGARALRDRTPPEVVERILAKMDREARLRCEHGLLRPCETCDPYIYSRTTRP